MSGEHLSCGQLSGEQIFSEQLTVRQEILILILTAIIHQAGICEVYLWLLNFVYNDCTNSLQRCRTASYYIMYFLECVWIPHKLSLFLVKKLNFPYICFMASTFVVSKWRKQIQSEVFDGIKFFRGTRYKTFDIRDIYRYTEVSVPCGKDVFYRWLSMYIFALLQWMQVAVPYG